MRQTGENSSPMAKRLYLLRHGKSSWKQSGLADHERPLAGRGRRAAEAIATHLEKTDVAVDLVLCSTARRARETFERIAHALGNVRVQHESSLYGATPATLLARLHAVPDDVDAVMLIGHNPAIEDLALELARPSSERRELALKFPTGALATLELDGPAWRDVQPGTGTLVYFVRPRDLKA
jgi:phosphohistidine phosphatase